MEQARQNDESAVDTGLVVPGPGLCTKPDCKTMSSCLHRLKNAGLCLTTKHHKELLNRLIHTKPENEAERLDSISFQCSLHFLPYREAELLLTALHDHHLAVGGTLHITIPSILSGIADGYEPIETSVVKRFAPLSEEKARRFGVEDKVCLYNLHELVVLVRDAGFEVKVTKIIDGVTHVHAEKVHA